MRTAYLLLAASLLGCSDTSAPTEKSPAELTILRLAPTSPPLFNPVDSFYALKGEDRELRIFFEDEVGAAGEEYLRLRVDAPSLVARPDGTPFATGDSVLITVRVVDPARILFQLEPAGLGFSSVVPARLKIQYDRADDDLDDDGDLDGDDESLEGLLAIWRQELPGDPFARIGSVRSEDLEEIDAELQGFSRYAIAY
jgi:hypothetical protein